MRRVTCIFFFVAFVMFPYSSQCFAEEMNTSFQTSSAWLSEINLPAKIAIVYSSSSEKLQSWRDAGYEIWMMTGASWLSKKTPVVVDNPGISQAGADGVAFEMIPGRAWVIPVAPWIEYMKGLVEEAIENGAKAVLPEEPEFFATNGYGQAFKDAWQEYFGEPWRPPLDSVENQWMSNKLKSHLFTEFYRQVFEHAESIDPAVKKIIPAHSNINYADWRIVAPHHAFSALPQTDGFIAQVWTGTAKHSHMLGGSSVADTFSYAMLEYSYYAELVRGTDLDVWFLTDPVEDAPGAPWTSLRSWYEETLIAALLHASVNKYECTPWPRRVFMDPKTYGDSPIPQEYASELFTIWAAQNELPANDDFPADTVSNVAFLTSDTLMWQRGVGADRFTGYLSLMLSTVREGYFPRVLPVERFVEENYPPEDIKLIVAGFDAWKPQSEAMVDALAEWVRSGGVLLFIGGSDEYNEVSNEWWSRAGFESPGDALLEKLGVSIAKSREIKPKNTLDLDITYTGGLREITPADDAMKMPDPETKLMSPLPMKAYAVQGSTVLMQSKKLPIVWEMDVSEGALVYAGFPAEFVSMRPEGQGVFIELLENAMKEHAGIDPWHPDAFVLRRGRFVIARGLTEPTKIEGTFVNLLGPEEPVITDPEIGPGESAFLMDVGGESGENEPAIILSSGRTGNVAVDDAGREMSYEIAGPTGRYGYTWVRIPDGGEPECETAEEVYVSPDGTLVRIKNSLKADVSEVELKW